MSSKIRATQKKDKKNPKELGIRSHYIHSSSSHKSIGLPATVPGAPSFG